MRGQKQTSGFTIVELLIVIVVIAILAAITIVAFNGVQVRARDAKRVQDISTIKKLILNYDTSNGSVPGPFIYGSTGGGGWDNSTLSGWMSFLPAGSKAPRDPTNNFTGDPLQPDSTGYGYFFYCHHSPEQATIGYFKESGGRTRVTEVIPVALCQ